MPPPSEPASSPERSGRQPRDPRLALLPGTVTARRGDGSIQVGLGRRRAQVPDTEEVRRLLATLRDGGDPTQLLGPHRAWSGAAATALARLDARGLVVPVGVLLAAVARERRDPVDPGGLSALLADDPRAAAGRRAARGAARWCVDADGRAEAWAAQVRALLVASGLQSPPRLARRPTRWEEADGGVLVSLGEPVREVADAAVRRGLPHLWVAVLPDHARVGPFVVPGVTACLRCRDATYAEQDPRMLVALAHTDGDAGDLAPAPADPVAVATAVALAARDVVTFVDGGVPATWSGTTEVPLTGPVRHHAWERHSWCGCSWDADLTG